MTLVALMTGLEYRFTNSHYATGLSHQEKFKHQRGEE